MKRHRLLLGFLLSTSIVTPGRAEASKILECNATGEIIGHHALYDIDFDASTVRQHAVNDDGAPFYPNGDVTSDATWPAQISENEIKWTQSAGMIQI